MIFLLYSRRVIFHMKQKFLPIIIIFPFLSSGCSDEDALEKAISRRFDPSMVISVKLENKTRVWMMSDGSIFYDKNGNGKPDYLVIKGRDGTRYGDDGSGWTMLVDN